MNEQDKIRLKTIFELMMNEKADVDKDSSVTICLHCSATEILNLFWTFRVYLVTYMTNFGFFVNSAEKYFWQNKGL